MATIIDTTPYWSNSYFGGLGGFLIGQSITAIPGREVLDSFSLFVTTAGPISLRGSVYVWDGFVLPDGSGRVPRIYGLGNGTIEQPLTDLFDTTVSLDPLNGSDYTMVTFDVGHLALKSGSVYILSIEGDQAGSVNFIQTDVEPTGNIWTMAESSGVLIGQYWDQTPEWDLSFKASFDTQASVPEPSTAILVALALGLAIVFRKHLRLRDLPKVKQVRNSG